MASDGKVTITIDLDGAKARGEVKSLKSMLMGLGDTSSKSFGTGSKSALGFGTAVAIASKAVSTAMGAISSSMGGAISRVDTMNRFPKMMQAMGFSADEAKGSVDALAKGIDGLPTALDEVVATTQQLALMNGDLGKSTKLTLALNDAFLASGSSAADASRGLVQFSQMMSSGKVDMQSWKTLMETMPLGLQKTAEAFGFAGASAKNDLYQALKDGTITFDQFSDKLIELDGGLNGFAELARVNSIGIATSFKNIKTAVVRGVANMIQAFDKAAQARGLGSIASNLDKVKKAVSQAFDAATPHIERFMDLIMQLYSTMERNGAIKALSWAFFSVKSAAESVFETFTKGSGSTGWILMASHAVETFGKVVASIAQGVKKFVDGFNETDAVKNFKLAVEDALNAIEKIAGAVQQSQIIRDLGKAFGEVVSQISQAVSTISEFISSMDPTTLQAIVDGIIASVVALKGLKTAKNVITSLSESFNVLRSAITGHPILTLAVIIAGLYTAFMTAYNGNEKFRKAVDKTVKAVTDFAKKVGDMFKGFDPSILIPIVGGLTSIIATLKSMGKLNGVFNIFKKIPNPFKKFGKNAKDAFDGINSSASQSKGIIEQIFSGIGSVIESVANGISTVVQGIGSALSTVVQGFGKAASMANPAQWFAMGAAFLMIGVGVTFAAAGIYILVQAAIQLANAGTGAQVALLALGIGIAVLAGIFALLGPALTANAAGILAFGAAVLMVGAGIGIATAGISLLAQQLPTIAEYGVSASVGMLAIGGALLAIGAGALVAGAGLLILGAGLLVAGVAALIAAVGALALGAGLLVLGAGLKVVSAALNSATPFIDAFSDAIAKVVTAISSGLTSILNALAGVIKEIGKSAQNAGNGFKALAQGVVMITNTNLADMAASLGAVAVGVGAISAASGGMASAGAGMKSLGQGLVMVSTFGAVAMTSLDSLKTAMTSLPSTLSTTATAFATFKEQAVAGMAGLSAINAPITSFRAQITAIVPALSMAVTAFAQLGSLASVVSSQLTMIATGTQTVTTAFATLPGQIQIAMQTALTAIISVGLQMQMQGRLIGVRTVQNMSQGLISGQGQLMSAMSALINAARAVGMSGVGVMRSVGAYIGQGLAQGMMSALGAVTAAANALVAQAERAAQAKARIHSPSRLFRDNVGRYISQGVAVGILADANKVEDAMGSVYDYIQSFSFRAEDVIGIGKSKLSKIVQVKSDLENAVKATVEVAKEKSNNLLKQALDVAEKAVERPVNTYLDGDVLVAKTGDRQKAYQDRKTIINNRMRGITI